MIHVAHIYSFYICFVLFLSSRGGLCPNWWSFYLVFFSYTFGNFETYNNKNNNNNNNSSNNCDI